MAEGPQLTTAGKLVVVLVIGASLYGAYALMSRSSRPAEEQQGQPAANPQAKQDPAAPPAAGEAVEIGIAYGTEKKYWLEAAARDFAETPAGRNIKVNLIPLGSLEGAQALLADDKRIHVWSPASALYKSTFVQQWRFKHNSDPIAREEVLALSPMVFVMWNERYESFVKTYKEVSFATIKQALDEKGGWEAIAGRPEWGFFKFSHTHPNQSNSGLVTLVLMAYDFHAKVRGLALKDIVNVEFQTWMQSLEGALERTVGGLSNSTGNLMRDMVLKGPSTFDAVFVYENVAIDYLENAEGRWGQLRIIYPSRNMWNENPYYIINADWSTPAQRRAAETFLDFLTSEPVQARSLEHGFRPGNPRVPINSAESPFVKYQKFGLQVDLPVMCEPPPSEVIHNLLAAWQRSQGR